MKKKIFMLTVAVATLMFSFASCEKDDDESASSTSPAVKVLQDRVVEVTYDTYDSEAGIEYFVNSYLPKSDASMGGCSAVRVDIGGDHYVGRNYDFYCSNTPAVVVRNNSGTYKTIGLANSPKSMPEWSGSGYSFPDACLAVLPFLCCDVMNSEGLYAETNIRIAEDGLKCTHTALGKPRRCTQTFMQTMLSQYASIEDIEKHVGDYDWFDLQEMGFEQSFLITDKDGKSVVFEFVNNECVWQESDCNANYYINPSYYAIENYPCGELRIQKEKEYLNNHGVNNEDDLFAMMETGAYDQFYHVGVDLAYAAPEYWSEAEVGYTRFTYPGNEEDCHAKVLALITKFDSYTWQERVDNMTWESTFITAANVSKKTLHVHFSEHYDIDFTVGF